MLEERKRIQLGCERGKERDGVIRAELLSQGRSLFSSKQSRHDPAHDGENPGEMRCRKEGRAAAIVAKGEREREIASRVQYVRPFVFWSSARFR